MGGECNYLLRVNKHLRLEFVPDHKWKTPIMRSWEEHDVQHVLSEAENMLLDTARYLRLPVKVCTLHRPQQSMAMSSGIPTHRDPPAFIHWQCSG